MERFIITEDMKRFISLQRTGIKSNFEKRYFKEIKFHWDTISDICINIKKSLDIGSGIGGIDFFIAKNNENCQINLLDKSKIEENVYYGFKEKGAFYNDLELAEKFLKINSVENEIKSYTPESDFSQLNDIDLVISLISWGFHYPIDTYIKLLEDVSKKDTILIIDIRNTHIEESLEKLKKQNFLLIKEIIHFEKCKRLLFKKI
jgi:hypothetical protein